MNFLESSLFCFVCVFKKIHFLYKSGPIVFITYPSTWKLKMFVLGLLWGTKANQTLGKF